MAKERGTKASLGGKFPQLNGRRRKDMSVNWLRVKSSLAGEHNLLILFETAGTE